MTLRSRANEIPELVRRLGSRRPAVVDAARARLAIVGGRAVEALIEALEGDNNRIRAHAMPLLALIRDPRGREPLVAMLLDRDARMREIAARCLARFPSPDAVAALERLLQREKKEEARIAAVHSLVEQYSSGQERAVRRVLETLYEPDEAPRVRSAALALVPLLRSNQRRSILRRLKQDPVPEVSARAQELESQQDTKEIHSTAQIQSLVTALASEDYSVWNDAVHRLAACGAPSVPPLIAEMQGRSHDPEYCTRAGMALKALGPRRGGAIVEALERVEEPLPLQVLVEVIGSLGEKKLIYRLKDLIDRVKSNPAGATDANGFDLMQRVRAKAHLELARIGSRVAIDDLHDAFSDPQRRVDLEMLAAVELIGKRDEIPELLRAHRREDRFMRERIASVVRTIMKRERIRRNNPMFQRLSADQRRALEAILPPANRRPRSIRKCSPARQRRSG